MAGQVAGPWLAVSNAVSPFTNQVTSNTTFFRVNQTVDTNSLHKKVMCGYQGWFRCPGDGASQWIHWSRNTSVVASNTLTVDMWPEMSEYTNKYLVPGFTYPDGTQAYLFSSLDQGTVDRHFDWMQEYGIDGVWASRFVVSGRSVAVLSRIQKAANRTGRTFAVMYDMSGQATNTLFSNITADWALLTGGLHVTNDPRYLHHNGKPVLMIWGFFTDRMTTNLANQIIDYFKASGVTLVGGGQWWWRTDTTPGWSDVFRRFDVYSPWNVGNYYTDGLNNKYASTGYWSDDMVAAASAGMLYLPVIYPGFSWDNLTQQPPGTSKISRLGGNFLWRQFYDAGNLGLDMAFVAMFDEVDEGTAIFKVSNTPPTQGYFATYEGMPADWYMRLAAEGTKILAGESPNTPTIPISP
jgi:hypothetical protein